MARVLVVDDDPSLLRALRLGLGAAGHEVLTATNAEQGIAAAARSSPDVMVLDLGLPDLDGLAVCRRVRAWSAVPIIVLSATDAEARKVAALDQGADDYVTKPFGMAELEARIRAAIRHRQAESGPEQPAVVRLGRLVLDRSRREARVGGEPVELTAKEFDVLAYLAANAGRLCTHQMILTSVWGATYGREAQYLHAYVHRLRQKVATGEGIHIRTAPGIGYTLELDASDGDSPDGGTT